ncbi:MAG: ABC transporter permease [Actinobacteria bacterium]|nr:ABC transporter permease [Actinomycetota bacterium]
MPDTSDRAIVRTSESPRLRPVARVGDIWAFREILVNLVRKELKVKYTKSVLGAAWSMLNPLFYLAVFSFVMHVIGRPVPDFPIYLLSGVIAWSFFSGSLTLATRSIIDNTSLVKKVYFPREILPLAAVGTSLVDFVLQYLVLIAFMLVTGYHFLGWNTLLFIPATVTMLIVTMAISFWVAAVNVTYRDVQHLLNLLLLAWFWLTPIVYPAALLQEKSNTVSIGGVSGFWFYLINPMGSGVMGFQRALYAVVAPIGADGQPQQVLADLTLGQLWLILTVVGVAGLGLLWFCWRTFFRLSGDFAEEL